ncbi:hypothetical protein HPG69_012175, partial [Diceros bicornis minor]
MPLMKECQTLPLDLLPRLLVSLFAAFSEVLLDLVSGPPAFRLVSLNFSDAGIVHQAQDFGHHCKWVNNCVGHGNYRFFMLLLLSLCLYPAAMLVTCLTLLVRTTHPPFSTDKDRGWGRIVGSIVVAVPAAGFLVPLFVLLLIKARSVSAVERSHESKVRGAPGAPRHRAVGLPDLRTFRSFSSALVLDYYLQEYNPFDVGCAKNWYSTLCAPLATKKRGRGYCSLDETGPSSLQGRALGFVLPKLRGTRPGGPQPLTCGLLLPRYMDKAVGLQSVVGPDWVPTQNLHFPTCPSMPSPPAFPGP